MILAYYYIDIIKAVENILMIMSISSRHRGRGQRVGQRPAEVPEEPHHLQSGAAGRAGEGVRQVALPMCEHPRKTGRSNGLERSQGAGECTTTPLFLVYQPPESKTHTCTSLHPTNHDTRS